MIPLTSAKVIGTPGQSGWVQVHDFFPDNPEKQKNRGRIFALILKEGREVDADTISHVREAREILTRLHEEYFGKVDEDAFVALTKAVDKVTQEWTKEEVKVSIGALVFLEDVVYGAASGNVSISLGREGSLVSLIQNIESNKTLSVSGVPKPGDTFVIMTQSFRSLIPAGILKAGITGGNITAFTESVTPQVYLQSDNSRAGVVVIGVSLSSPEPVTQHTKKINGGVSQLGKVTKSGKGILVRGVDALLAIIPERKITVRHETVEIQQSKKKFVPLIGLILVFILFLSISLGVRERNRRETKKEFETELTQAQHEFLEAQTLTALNPERARELALSAKRRANALKDKGIDDPKLNEFLSLLADQTGTITGIFEFEPELYLDLTLVSSGFVGTDMAFSEGEVSVLDGNARKLVGINLSTKRTAILAGPDFLLSPHSLAQYTNRSFVLSSDGVRRIDDEVELVIKESWDPQNRLLAAFAGNIYILEKQENKIWRYPQAGSGYGEKSFWLANDIETDFSEAFDWAIDGSVWVYSSDGRVRKFTQGVPQVFSPSSYLSLSGMTDFFTSEGSEYLYFLDAAHSKIIVVTKEGSYKAEYVSDKIKEGLKIAVSEEDKILLLLTGEKLYSLPLNHL